jgi:hypothetical protein
MRYLAGCVSVCVSLTVIARQWLGKHILTEMNMHATEEESESELQLLYAWRFTANQFVLVPNPLRIYNGPGMYRK